MKSTEPLFWSINTIYIYCIIYIIYTYVYKACAEYIIATFQTYIEIIYLYTDIKHRYTCVHFYIKYSQFYYFNVEHSEILLHLKREGIEKFIREECPFLHIDIHTYIFMLNIILNITLEFFFNIKESERETLKYSN